MYNSIVIAVGLVIVRLLGLYCATAISARVLKAPAVSDITGERRKNIEWMGHVTQAGVAPRFVAHRRREISVLGPRVFDAGRVRDRHQLIHRPRVISRIHRTHERVALDAQRGVGAHRRDAQVARSRRPRPALLPFSTARRAPSPSVSKVSFLSVLHSHDSFAAKLKLNRRSRPYSSSSRFSTSFQSLPLFELRANRRRKPRSIPVRIIARARARLARVARVASRRVASRRVASRRPLTSPTRDRIRSSTPSPPRAPPRRSPRRTPPNSARARSRLVSPRALARLARLPSSSSRSRDRSSPPRARRRRRASPRVAARAPSRTARARARTDMNVL